MPLPAAILLKLRKLIPLLSSEQVGEVVATAGAIARMLKAAGATWHDLTAQLTGPRVDRKPSSRQSRRTPMPDTATLLGDLLDHPGLSDWEFEFVESVYGQYSRRWRLSERQLEVLERIWRKIEERAA